MHTGSNSNDHVHQLQHQVLKKLFGDLAVPKPILGAPGFLVRREMDSYDENGRAYLSVAANLHEVTTMSLLRETIDCLGAVTLLSRVQFH